MKKIRRQCLVMVGGSILSVLFVASNAFADPVNPWTEVGDAGDQSNPQLITGGLFDAISGNLGEGTDEADAFKFHWSGGVFAAKWFGPDPFDIGGIGSVLSGRFSIGVLDSANNILAQDISTTGISTADLAAGNYTFLIIINSGQGPDPAYTMQLSGLIGEADGTGIGVPDSGSSLILLSCGLLALFSVHAVRPKMAGMGTKKLRGLPN